MAIVKEERIGDCRLILGDCLEVMPLLESIDAVVTDPPYGIGESAGKAATRTSGLTSKLKNGASYKRDYGNKSWDESIADKEIAQAVELARHSIVFGGNYYDLPPTSCWLVWNKLNGATDFADCELAWTNLPKAVRKIDWLWNGCMRREKHIPRQHPTQKPLRVMEWCIEQLPNTAETILDPFMGSGTTLVACAKLGRKGIGIELDSEYFDVACQRVADAYKQPDLFIEADRKPDPKPPLLPGM